MTPQLPKPINRARGGPFMLLSLVGILGLLDHSIKAYFWPPLQGNFPTMPYFTLGSYSSSELSGSSSGSEAPSQRGGTERVVSPIGGSLSMSSSRALSVRLMKVRN